MEEGESLGRSEGVRLEDKGLKGDDGKQSFLGRRRAFRMWMGRRVVGGRKVGMKEKDGKGRKEKVGSKVTSSEG